MTRNDEVWKRATQMAEDQWDDKTTECRNWLTEAFDYERGDSAWEAARELYLSACSGMIDNPSLDTLKELYVEHASNDLYGCAAAEIQDEAEALRDEYEEARREEARQSEIRG
jgi:hypothetical protein